MPHCDKPEQENVCKCDKRAKTTCARHARAGFPSACPSTGERSGVLLGTEIALVIEAFLARTALVVIPVRWGIGCDAVLRRRVRCIGRAGWNTAGARFALRVARGAPQCRVSHDRCLQGKAATERWHHHSLEPGNVNCR